MRDVQSQQLMRAEEEISPRVFVFRVHFQDAAVAGGRLLETAERKKGVRAAEDGLGMIGPKQKRAVVVRNRLHRIEVRRARRPDSPSASADPGVERATASSKSVSAFVQPSKEKHEAAVLPRVGVVGP